MKGNWPQLECVLGKNVLDVDYLSTIICNILIQYMIYIPNISKNYFVVFQNIDKLCYQRQRNFYIYQ